MNKHLIFALIFSALLTLVLETVFFFLTGKRDKKDLLLIILVNLLTNPIVVLTYWMLTNYMNSNEILVKTILEISAVLIEGYYYKKYGRNFHHPYVWSASANAFSFGMGILIQQFI